MDINIDAVQMMTDVPECMSICQIKQTTSQDEHLQCLKSLIISGWPDTKDKLHQDIRPYWSFRDELAVIDDVVMKGRSIIIPEALKQQALNQLHINHMGIEKTKLLAHESIYWFNVNNDIERYIKIAIHVLNFGKHSSGEKNLHHDIPIRPWDVVGVDIFQLNNKKIIYVMLITIASSQL